MEALHFGTDGWRDRYEEGFNEANVARIVDAAARLFARSDPNGAVIVGYDTRADGVRMAQVAAGVISGHGLSARLSDGCCPIPALSWSVAHDPAVVGSIMITASRSSADLNGVKVRMADGGPCSDDFAAALDAGIASEPPVARGDYVVVDVIGPYLENLMSLFGNGAAEPSHGLSVVHDPMFGSSRDCVARALRALGVEVSQIHEDDDATFGGIRPLPIEPWVADCQKAVAKTPGIYAGLVNDTNGIRVGAVDESGLFVSSHKITALILEFLVNYCQRSGRVVMTTPGSELVRRQAARLGCPLTVTPVGFRWVYGELLRGDVLLGAEESGGICIPGHLYERDGILADILLCEYMARTGKRLGELVSDLEDKVGHMDYGQRDLELDAASIQMFRNMLPGLNPQAMAGMRPVDVDHTDGLRLGFADDAWVLLRPSGTDQIVRVYAEAPTILERDALLDEGCALARGELG